MLRLWVILMLATGPVLAETPPGDFSGKQYVDRRGCVFIRVGLGEWVARVTRRGEPVCGYQPSLQHVASATPPPVTKPNPKPRPAQRRLPHGYESAWDDGRVNLSRGINP